MVCAIKSSECTDCLLKEKCVYSYIFETPPSADTKIMRKYKSAPHPFIIEPPTGQRRAYNPRDEISFGLTLIGRAIDYFPYFIYAFDELGRIGLGKGKGKFELRDVGCNEETIYDSETKTLRTFKPNVLSFDPDLLNSETSGSELITLHFLTPTRIVYNGHLTLDLEFHILVRNLLRRLSLLYYFHCNGDPSEWNFREIIKKAEGVKVSGQGLRWHEWERYSARQKTRMNMGGFVGGITFEGATGPFMDLIRAGEVLHVGKGTGFGLGRYEIVGDAGE